MSLRELEGELIGEKDWILKGEVKGNDRPLDSLLEVENIEIPISSVRLHAEKFIDENGQENKDDIEKLVKSLICERRKHKLYDNMIEDEDSEDNKKVVESSVLDDNLITNPPAESLVASYLKQYNITSTGATIEVGKIEREAIELWKKISTKIDMYCASM